MSVSINLSNHIVKEMEAGLNKHLSLFYSPLNTFFFTSFGFFVLCFCRYVFLVVFKTKALVARHHQSLNKTQLKALRSDAWKITW